MNLMFDFGTLDLIGVFIVLLVAFVLVLSGYLYDKNRELRWKTSIQEAIEKKYEKKEENSCNVVQFRRPED